MVFGPDRPCDNILSTIYLSIYLITYTFFFLPTLLFCRFYSAPSLVTTKMISEQIQTFQAPKQEPNVGRLNPLLTTVRILANLQGLKMRAQKHIARATGKQKNSF